MGEERRREAHYRLFDHKVYTGMRFVIKDVYLYDSFNHELDL